MNTQDAARIKTPAFPVFRIAAAQPGLRGGTVGSGNAVLLDSRNGYSVFVTNAHVVNFKGGYRSNELYVCMPHSKRIVKADFYEEWIDWNADLAYFRLAEDELLSYPKPNMKTSGFTEYASIKVVGNVSGKDASGERVEISGIVVMWKHNVGVTFPAIQERHEVEAMWRVPKDKRAILYKNYIWFSCDEDGMVPSVSGSALVDENGNLAGIVSRAGGRVGLAIPASELNPSPVLDWKPSASSAHCGSFFGWLTRKRPPPALG